MSIIFTFAVESFLPSPRVPGVGKDIRLPYLTFVPPTNNLLYIFTLAMAVAVALAISLLLQLLIRHRQGCQKPFALLRGNLSG